MQDTTLHTMQYFILFLTALFASTSLVGVLIHYAVRLGFLDIPDARKVHLVAIPRVGGIGMVLGTVLALLLWLEDWKPITLFLSGTAVLSLFGILDDRYDLNYRYKFAGQLVAVLIVTVLQPIQIGNLFGYATLPPALSYPLTVFFLLGTTNAMNLSDGLDGLAAGLSVMSLASIAYLALLAGGSATIAISIAIIAASLGFLRYNTHPAQAFMGDTGSQFLGFSIGILSIQLTQSVNTALSGMLPLFLLGLPVVDTLRVMVERLAKGGSPFKPDRNHFHHKLLAMGLDHYESVLAIYLIQGVFLGLAFLLRYESDVLNLGVYLLVSLVLFAFFPFTKSIAWSRPKLAKGEVSLLARSWRWLMAQTWLAKSAYLALSAAIPAFLLAGTLTTPCNQADLGWFAGSVWLLWSISWLPGLPAWAATANRIALYSCVSLVIYGIGINQIHTELEDYFHTAIFVLAALVAVGFVFSPKHLSVTPSDYLVMGILVVSSSLPVFGEINYAKLATEAAVVLYSMESVLRRPGRGRWTMQAGCWLVLAFFTLRSFTCLPLP